MHFSPIYRTQYSACNFLKEKKKTREVGGGGGGVWRVWGEIPRKTFIFGIITLLDKQLMASSNLFEKFI